jgi:tripartite-type tricarboxylate transporter receptor subunit TctC
MITFELVSYKPLDLFDLGPDDFKAIVQLNEDPAAITVHADSEWQTLDDFLAYAKANPGQITVGNSGPGAVWHLGAVKLEELAEVDFSHIPHNGAKPAVTQLLGQHIDAVAVSPAEVLQYVQNGTLRCLGIMAEARDPQLPDVPTFQEQGVNLVHGTWRGIAAPKDTPDDIVEKLEAGFTQAYLSEAFQSTAHNAMLGLKYRDSDEFQQFLAQEAESVAQLVDSLDI